MTLEEEKKLVAEKLLGLKEDPNYPNRCFRKDRLIYIDSEGTGHDWNPQSDRNCWPEIWEY
jgi:hypothetical protein